MGETVGKCPITGEVERSFRNIMRARQSERKIVTGVPYPYLLRRSASSLGLGLGRPRRTEVRPGSERARVCGDPARWHVWPIANRGPGWRGLTNCELAVSPKMSPIHWATFWATTSADYAGNGPPKPDGQPRNRTSRHQPPVERTFPDRLAVSPIQPLSHLSSPISLAEPAGAC